MKTDALGLQLRCIDDGILCTERSIRRLEHLVENLSDADEDRMEAVRQLERLRRVRQSFDEIRADLLEKLESSTDVPSRMPASGAV